MGLISDTSDAVFSIDFVDTSSSVFEYNSNKLVAYPNPSKGMLNFSFINEPSITYDNVYVYSLEGKLIKVTQFTKELNLTNVNEGIYFVVLVNEKSGNRITKKIEILK
jgi:hypothetical protein